MRSFRTALHLGISAVIVGVMLTLASGALGAEGLTNAEAGSAGLGSQSTGTANGAAKERTGVPSGAAKRPTSTPTGGGNSQPPASGTGNVAIFKDMCTNIGQQNTCNERDSSLAGYDVVFKVYEGAGSGGKVVDTITVTMGRNKGGHGNIGGGSQGRAEGKTFTLSPTSVYTVCEEPVATKGAAEPVNLVALPRPDASTGGVKQGSASASGSCITVTLSGGLAELKFLDQQAAPPTATATVPAVASPTATAEVVATPTGTTIAASPTVPAPTATPPANNPAPTATPASDSQPTATPANNPQPTATRPAHNPQPTATPRPNNPAPTAPPAHNPQPSATPASSQPKQVPDQPVKPSVSAVPTPLPTAVVLSASVSPAPVVVGTSAVRALPAAGAGGLWLSALPLSMVLVNTLVLLGFAMLTLSHLRLPRK